ncbi:uncharacterized protein GGS25DRAFT_495438 [Hypoxylon fragiforme]|uniref:uncharacterized protein n=1 Tax=Hypoxylon fragiforme TaxID=63214 RepID=UPI0020C66582|nr:uncharacterized protein GGS25DRAFT_495438 [Hypoxylon fragiforme]KAI2607342.1 hypothetical protein GGS25DRAFT_495438 [Hypoxylon fragiforme]
MPFFTSTFQAQLCLVLHQHKLLQQLLYPSSLCYSANSKHFKRPSNRRLFHITTSIRMPTYIVTCKSDATPEQVAAAKKHAQDQGGKIGHEYNLIKGFSVTFPNDAISTLESSEHVQAVELDQEVKAF